MPSSASRPPRERITVEHLCQMAAEAFGAIGNRRPSHCDVRCAINDLIDGYERDGAIVYHGYNQDRAFRRVRAILASGREEVSP